MKQTKLLVLIGAMAIGSTTAFAGAINFEKENERWIKLDFSNYPIPYEETTIPRSKNLHGDLKVVRSTATQLKNKYNAVDACFASIGGTLDNYSQEVSPELELEKENLIEDGSLSNENVKRLRKICKNTKLYKRCGNINPRAILNVLEEFDLVSDYEIKSKELDSCLSTTVNNATGREKDSVHNFALDYIADKLGDVKTRKPKVNFGYYTKDGG